MQTSQWVCGQTLIEALAGSGSGSGGPRDLETHLVVLMPAHSKERLGSLMRSVQFGKGSGGGAAHSSSSAPGAEERYVLRAGTRGQSKARACGSSAMHTVSGRCRSSWERGALRRLDPWRIQFGTKACARSPRPQLFLHGSSLVGGTDRICFSATSASFGGSYTLALFGCVGPGATSCIDFPLGRLGGGGSGSRRTFRARGGSWGRRPLRIGPRGGERRLG